MRGSRKLTRTALDHKIDVYEMRLLSAAAQEIQLSTLLCACDAEQ